MARRVSGDRAAVFLEFAFAMPILMTLSLFILELCLFWDTEVMANHAAFAIARIAKVNIYHGRDTSPMEPYQRLRIGSASHRADRVVAAMFMMTSTFSWMKPPSRRSNVDFRNYFTIDKPLFQVTVDNDANIFVKIIGSFIKSMADKMDSDLRKYLNTRLKNEIDDVFGGVFVKEMNTRFNMALQRTTTEGTVRTEIIPLSGSLAHPTEDHPSDRYSNPEVVKVSIDYPLHKGGWLYAMFAYWKSGPGGGKAVDAPVACGRYAMLVEPDKVGLEDLHAKDDGGTTRHDYRKDAEKHAAKVIAKTSKAIDSWEAAVKRRVKLQKKYGGYKSAIKHQDFFSAIYKERDLWGHVQKGERDYFNILSREPKDGGLCGDKSNRYNGKCGSKPTPFGKCARSESSSLRFCKKVAGRVNGIADKYDLHFGKSPALIHYVEERYSHPYTTPMSVSIPCDKKLYICPPFPNYK